MKKMCSAFCEKSINMFIVMFVFIIFLSYNVILEKKKYIFSLFFSPRFSLKYYLLSSLDNFAPNYKFLIIINL